MNRHWIQQAKYGWRQLLLRGPLGEMRPYQGAYSNLAHDLLMTWRRRDLCIAMAFNRAVGGMRGTFFGPFWIAISFAIAVLGLTTLWSFLLNRPMAVFLPYVTLGFFTWTLFIGAITYGSRALISSKSFILQTKAPLTLYPTVALASNFVAALHNVPFVVLVMFLCPPPISSEIFLAIPGLFLLGIAALGIAIGLSVCCAYMPDLAEFISSMLRFVFFFTPIWWMPNMRPSVEPFVLANPFYHVVNVVRGPILHGDHVMISFCVMSGMCVLIWLCVSWIYWNAAGAVATRL